LADMTRLGMKDAVHLGASGHEQDSKRFRQHLLTPAADDCLALLK
jgi:hypothetical protein